MNSLILSEVDQIRGKSEIFSVNKILDDATDTPEQYPGITALMERYDHKLTKTKISLALRKSGKYERWNSATRYQCSSVWRVIS